MTSERFPVQNEDRERVVFRNSSTAYSDPLVLPKWSNQISASSVYVPLKKKKIKKNKTNKKNAATVTETDGSPVCRSDTCSPFWILRIFRSTHRVSNMVLVSLMLACRRQVNNNEDTQTYILYPYYTFDALYNSAELKTCFFHA